MVQAHADDAAARRRGRGSSSRRMLRDPRGECSRARSGAGHRTDAQAPRRRSPREGITMLTDKEEIARLQARNAELAARVKRLEQAVLPAAPKAAPVPAWAGPQGNFGASYSGPPSPDQPTLASG